MASQPTTKPLATRARVSDKEQMIILKEIVAVDAHVAKYCSIICRFEEATRAINSNTHFRINIKTRAVREKIAKMVKENKTKDRKDRASSGFGGEESLVKDMLAGIVEEMDGVQEARKKKEVRRAEKRN